jgi:hypothetical protein
MSRTFTRLAEKIRVLDVPTDAEQTKAEIAEKIANALDNAQIPGFNFDRFMAHATSTRNIAPVFRRDENGKAAYVWIDDDGTETIAYTVPARDLPPVVVDGEEVTTD